MSLLELIGLFFIIYSLIYAVLPWFLDCDLKLAFYEKFGKPISSLRGKVVWITGASSGIGEHLAYVLATAGCKIILSARRHKELERVKANCMRYSSDLEESDIEICSFDICNLTVHEDTFKHVIDKFGKLDILVNNAGRSQRAKWQNIDLAVDREMFDLNVFSHLSLCRLVTKYFLEVGHGHIVATSSLAGVIPVPFSATYCATKHALHGYLRSLTLETLDKDITVTLACPGPIQTNFLAEAFTERPGEKFGMNTAASKSKMPADRCAKLMAIGMANKLDEVWITPPFVLQLTYAVIYTPNLGAWLVRQLGSRFLQGLRDTKVTVNEDH